MPSPRCVALDDADEEMLEALTHKVRVLSVRQIARTWCCKNRTAERTLRRIQALASAEWIVSFSMLVHPELPLLRPIIEWRPGDSLPDFGPASYACISRWTEPAVMTTAVIATERAALHFGGFGGRYPRESEETHDLHLAALYLRLRFECPELAAAWISEEHIKARRINRNERVPDAMIDRAGNARVIEFGGAYKAKKLEAFHLYCAERNLPYEVW